MDSSDSSSVEQLRRRILDDGFCYRHDSAVGKRVIEIREDNFPFKTEGGLDFCIRNTFDNKVGKGFSPYRKR